MDVFNQDCGTYYKIQGGFRSGYVFKWVTLAGPISTADLEREWVGLERNLDRDWAARYTHFRVVRTENIVTSKWTRVTKLEQV